MVTCAQCGATLTEGAAFCGVCGTPLGHDGTVPGSPIRAAVEVEPPPAPPAPAQAPAVAPGPPLGAPLVGRRGTLPVGTLIDKKYAVVRVLGEGGMGVVYLARDIHTGLDVVVKAVRSELAHRADVRQRTLAEGRALAQIDHPNVVHLKAVVVDGQALWLVMQYIDGESLDKTIGNLNARGEKMPVAEALGLLRQIAAGLGAAHQEGVIHRDMKPANVLLRKKDRVAKVTDFGIAKVPSDQSREQTKGILGSLWYMSPEQVTGRRDLDKRVDIYALGIVLYQMLVGDVPFDAESDYEIMKLHAEAPMPRVAARRPDVPAAVDELIQKACAKDRDQRFQTCEEMIAAIDRALSAPARTVTIPDADPPLDPVAPAHRPSAEHAARASTTGQGAELPAATPKKSGAGRWAAVLVALVTLGGGAAAVLSGMVPGVGPRRAHGRGSETARPSATPPPSAPGSSTTAPVKSPLDTLSGAWSVNGKDLDAVLVGDVLEFRVRTPAQFDPQDYEAGEARFALRATAEVNVFSVEDRIRPFPPVGKTYAPKSRNSCQEVWTTAGGEPLRARWDGKRLAVEFAKIEPNDQNFTISAGKITECRGLRDLPAARLVNTLARP